MTSPAEGSPVWLITGCSNGFGREFAEVALERGARVVATARDPSRLADLVAGREDRCLAIALDVTDPAQVADAIVRAKARFGRIDVLVNNAGRGFFGAVEEASDAEVRALFELNVFGQIAMIRAVLPGMRRRRSGAIVNISSIAGVVGREGSGIYGATKFALEGLTQSLAAEVAPFGIRVMAVQPGPFRTNFTAAAGRAERRIDDYRQTAVGKRLAQLELGHGRQRGDPRRAAEAVMDALASPEPPQRLVLGAAALAPAREFVARVGRELETWADVTLGADFPDEPAAR
jgi:NAD(P)-dependent dehydrogenase (short-subunit alcohol dehydrogenase family)